ncbi:MAG: class I tRNA ligase family protein, partial [Bacilli bacterium]
EGDMSQGCYSGDGLHINSDFINGLNQEEATSSIIAYLEKMGLGRRDVNYKIRDWIFSRQRYWGEPFPVIMYEDGSIEVLEEKDLPLELPILSKITSSKTGESPLVNAHDWLHVVRHDGVKGRRETNTMPQWAGSCWYYIGYLLKNEGDYLPLSDPIVQEKINSWLPVDLYIGGTEHAVLHLLYSRFWHKVLYDCGIVNSIEPFQKLFNQGMILGEDGEKMSKSKGNVINPDDVITEYGADTLRLYEMFMGPLEATKPWSTKGVEGPRRFLERVYRLYKEVATVVDSNPNLEKVYHQTVKKVTNDFETLRFNTAISQLMIFINECYKDTNVPYEYLIGFLKLLNPIAPHITEELYSQVFNQAESITYSSWPTYDEDKTKDDLITFIIQVNGKIRDKIEVAAGLSKEELKTLALNNVKAQAFYQGMTVLKVIVVPNKLVNIVVN